MLSVGIQRGISNAWYLPNSCSLKKAYVGHSFKERKGRRGGGSGGGRETIWDVKAQYLP